MLTADRTLMSKHNNDEPFGFGTVASSLDAATESLFAKVIEGKVKKL